MLEAKLYLGNNLVCSIASEPIENSEEYINQSEEKITKFAWITNIMITKSYAKKIVKTGKNR